MLDGLLGGGIDDSDAAGVKDTFENNTITQNTVSGVANLNGEANEGAGFMLYGSNPTLINNLIQGNQSIGSSTPDFGVFPAFTTPLSNATNNFIGSMSTNAVSTTTNIIGNSQEQLASVVGIASSGKPTGGPIYYPLLTGSLSIGAGSTSALDTIASAEGTTSANATDEIGNPRTSSGSIDLGAVQFFTGSAPIVTANPTSQTVMAGDNVSFTAAASSNPAATVQWQVSFDGGKTWVDWSGGTSTTLTLADVQPSQDQTMYRAVFTNGVGSTTTSAATLTVQYAPIVRVNPNDFQYAMAGQNVEIRAAASADPTPTVQWQVSSDNGMTWADLSDGANISGATTPMLDLSNVQPSQNRDEYQAIFTNTIGSATTSAARLIVLFAPIVTTNPSSQTVTAGQNATFTAAANANPEASVQWEVSSDGGKTFSDLTGGNANISGANSTTLTLYNVPFSFNGNEYLAVFYNSYSPKATTNAATLTVQSPPVVTTNPNSKAATAGQTVEFTAAANVNPTPTVQWQISTDGGNTWSSLSDGGEISGSATNTLTLSNVLLSQDGSEYRAVFTNDLGTATTTAAMLTVGYAPSVTTSPSNQTVTAGDTATFTAAANGYPTPSVQWQVSSDGGKTFTDISGATSTTLTLNGVTAAMNSNEYQAVFSNSLGGTTTSTASLTVNFGPIVTTNPSSQTANAGQNAAFNVAANANPVASVQWQLSTDGGNTFNNISGATSTTLTLTAVTAVMNGNQYQAVFTNGLGSAATSVATLMVDYAPTITTNPSSQTVTAGQNVTFAAAAANANPQAAVQWQVSTNNGATWTNISGATAATLTLTNVLSSQNGYMYQAVFSNGIGNAVSSAATLSVSVPPSPPPSPPQPPTLNVPPLLAFLDSLFGGTETVKANGTETITDSFFGIPLLVSTFDSNGNLMSVDLFGFFDIMFWFV